MLKGKVHAINCSQLKGTPKKSILEAVLIEDFGLEGDAHAGPGLRQVSLLARESIRKQEECTQIRNKDVSLQPGDFAENITTEGLELSQLKIGDSIKIGQGVVLELSKIGKECHGACAIRQKTGDCIMPKEGIFARVIQGGRVFVGDEIEGIRNV